MILYYIYYTFIYYLYIYIASWFATSTSTGCRTDSTRLGKLVSRRKWAMSIAINWFTAIQIYRLSFPSYLYIYIHTHIIFIYYTYYVNILYNYIIHIYCICTYTVIYIYTHIM